MSQQTTPLLTLAALLLASSAMHAQAYTPPPPPLTTAPCVPTKKDPCTAPNTTPPPAKVDKFAFPGDDPATPDTPPADPASKPSPTPTSPAPASSDPFPFPTADSKAPLPSSSSSSSSASTSPSSTAPDDPDQPHLKDEGSSGNTRASRRKLAKVEDPDTREAKDIEVARFYLSTGNFIGAYARAKDAIRLYPDDAEAHFALAAAAQKLKKNDEAVAEYHSYLKLDPDGNHVKVAQHALAEIH